MTPGNIRGGISISGRGTMVWTAVSTPIWQSPDGANSCRRGVNDNGTQLVFASPAWRCLISTLRTPKYQVSAPQDTLRKKATDLSRALDYSVHDFYFVKPKAAASSFRLASARSTIRRISAARASGFFLSSGNIIQQVVMACRTIWSTLQGPIISRIAFFGSGSEPSAAQTMGVE